MFRHISYRAEQQGLKVNIEKTTLLAMSAGTSYRAKAHLYNESNNRVDCSPTLKALGFLFNEQADVTDQVEQLCKRFRSRTWALRDLRKASLLQDDVCLLYTSPSPRDS